MQNVGVVNYLYKEFAEIQGTQKDQKHNNLGYWRKPTSQIGTSGTYLDNNRDIPIVKNVMKMTSSQIVISNSSPDKLQPVNNVKY